MVDDDSYYDDDDDDRPNRPNFLDLAGQSGSTPMSSRKPRFQFSGKLKKQNKYIFIKLMS